MGKKAIFAAIAATLFLTGLVVAADKDDIDNIIKETQYEGIFKPWLRKKILEVMELEDPLQIITNEDRYKKLKEEIEELEKKGNLAKGMITEKRLNKLFDEILKEREGEEHWQKIKPTEKEWNKWQSGLDQIGRFHCIQGHKDLPFTYIFDTKEGHVWILESFSQISYIGRVFPLKEMDERIRGLP